jgi:hypothetical protein
MGGSVPVPPWSRLKTGYPGSEGTLRLD